MNGDETVGRWFSNIQIRCDKEDEMRYVSKIKELFEEENAISETCKENADIEIILYRPEESKWISVYSDLIEENPEVLHEKAKRFSEKLNAETIMISCMDSDYLCMNLIDPKNQVDTCISCGNTMFESEQHKNNYEEWKSYVDDVEAFKNALTAEYAFKEECLYNVAPLFSLTALQSINCVPDNTSVYKYYYKYMKKNAENRPTKFICDNPQLNYHADGGVNVASFINRGEASNGIAVCLSGISINKRQLEVKSICIQMHDKTGEWMQIPIELERRELEDGRCELYGECTQIHIPAAVSEGFPSKKKREEEFMRSIAVRFTLEDKRKINEADETLEDIYVTIIPLKNTSGRCEIVLKEQSRILNKLFDKNNPLMQHVMDLLNQQKQVN